MTNSKSPKPESEVDNIEDALIESILTASSVDLREEIALQGENADDIVKSVDNNIAKARAEAARERLAHAKSSISAFNAEKVRAAPLSLDDARRRLREWPTGGNQHSPKMLAARKGATLSPQDELGMLDDMADLERLEREDSE